MRPLDVARNMYLDYSAVQSIKFYNKGVEKLPGEAFNGKLLLTWLIQVQDKANMFTWTSILTINGRPLTQNFTKITMEEVRAHAQVYQDRNLIEALKEAPDSNFQRWLSNQVDLWSMRKLDWKQDGSDLMEEAEIYYQEAMNTHRWGRKTYRPDVG